MKNLLFRVLQCLDKYVNEPRNFQYKFGFHLRKNLF